MDATQVQAPAAPPKAGLRHYALALALAVAGGLLGILGALFEELRAGGGILVLFIGAPIIEELLKPAGIYILLARWPYVVRKQLGIASLTAISGLTFGLLESVVYVTLYHPDASGTFVAFRFSVPVLLHTSCSFIAGLGINRRLIEWADAFGPGFPRASRNGFAAAMILHAAYNTIVVVLQLTDTLSFD